MDPYPAPAIEKAPRRRGLLFSGSGSAYAVMLRCLRNASRLPASSTKIMPEAVAAMVAPGQPEGLVGSVAGDAAPPLPPSVSVMRLAPPPFPPSAL